MVSVRAIAACFESLDQIEVAPGPLWQFGRQVLHVGITHVVYDEKDLAEFQEESS